MKTGVNEWLRRADKAIKTYNANSGEDQRALAPMLARLVDEMRRWLGPNSDLEEGQGVGAKKGFDE